MNAYIHLLFNAVTSRLPFLMLLYAFWLVAPDLCNGGGILHVFPPTFQEQTFAVARPTVLLSRTEVTVSETYVAYRSDQTFFNDNEFPLEGVFLFPLDKVRFGVKPEVRVNGVPHPSNVVPPEEFFPTLRKYTAAMQDPSLLSLAGRTVLVVQPVNIGVRQQRTFRIQFQQPTCIQDNQFELALPLDGERYSLGPVGEIDILVRFKLSRPLRTIFSPTHHLSIARESPHRCLVSSRGESKRIRNDFRILATFSGEDVDFRLFARKDSAQKGTFMAFIAPPLLTAGEKEPDKDVVFLMDRSGSVGTANLALSKQAVTAALERLRPGDRFNVLTFGTRTSSLEDRLVTANDDNIIRAVRFVNSAVAGGGSDLYNALIAALEQFTSRRRPSMVLMAGDGRPTIGMTSPDEIIENLGRLNKFGARVFALAVGDGADLTFLDKVAQTTRGSSFQLSGKEPFHDELNRFLARISPPTVSQISMSFQDTTAEEVVPNPIPDLFSEEGIIVFGRFTDAQAESGKVRLKAIEKGRPQSFVRTVKFPSEAGDGRHYIPDIWAMRQIALLLERERFKGPERETQDKMARLAREFGFKMPSGAGRSTADSGELFWQFKTSLVPEDVESDLVRRVQGRVFYREGVTWVDAEYRGEAFVQTVRFLSDEYFALLKEHPQLGSFFALGPEIVLVRPTGVLRVTTDNRQGSN